MKKEEAKFYRCPHILKPLKLQIDKQAGEEIIEGALVNEEGIAYTITEGVLDITWPKELARLDDETRRTYDQLADEYEKYADIPFQTYKVSEDDVRADITNRLSLAEGMKILEIGGGDGRGAEHIIKRLGKNGKLYFQELSLAFLKKAQDRLSSFSNQIEFSVANGCYLSFPDNAFDAAHHFGGINTFSDVRRSLAELVRVVKPGGRVVVGDEGMAPWLRETEFGKIMMNSNPLLKYEVPFKDIPVEARQVKVEWIMKGAFFLLEFEVGEGEPEANYFVPIPSERGGNHWTRYHGQLEGVTEETKKLAYEAQKQSGLSMYEWLDTTVKKEAKQQLQIESDQK